MVVSQEIKNKKVFSFSFQRNIALQFLIILDFLYQGPKSAMSI